MGGYQAEKQTRTGIFDRCLFVAETDSGSSVVLKVGMVGDSQIGKTSLMVKYVEGSFE